MTQDDFNLRVTRRDYCSIIIVKPDLIEIGIENDLKEIIKQNRLKISLISKIVMDLEFVKEFYQWDKIKFPKEINEYLCDKKLSVWFIEGDNAIKKVLNIKKYLRKKYSIDEMHNLIHCPDSYDDFKREYRLILDKIKNCKMRTNNQIEVILFKRRKKEILFLILKRSIKKGGFWQPITGGVEENETFEEAAIREISEEVGITENVKLIDIDYSFEFLEENIIHFEKVFGLELSSMQKIILSEEHTEFKWVDGSTAITDFLKYPGNKEGFRKLINFLEKMEVNND
jgi:dATP pyrophosphohydrolase